MKSGRGQWRRSDGPTAFSRQCGTASTSERLSNAATAADLFGSPGRSRQQDGCHSPTASLAGGKRMRIGSIRCNLEAEGYLPPDARSHKTTGMVPNREQENRFLLEENPNRGREERLGHDLKLRTRSQTTWRSRTAPRRENISHDRRDGKGKER